jgi:hypothetical protein
MVQQIKDSFAENGQVKDIGVPDELTKTESLADVQLRRLKELLPR